LGRTATDVTRDVPQRSKVPQCVSRTAERRGAAVGRTRAKRACVVASVRSNRSEADPHRSIPGRRPSESEYLP